MHPNRAMGKKLLFALLWALSMTAFCVSLGDASAPAETSAGWTRSLPSTGVWFLAAVALGLGYASLMRYPMAFAKARLWILSAVFALIVTLGESFVQTGTAERVISQPWVALLFFAGRVPAYMLGMSLLSEALSRPYPADPVPETQPVRLPYAPHTGVDSLPPYAPYANVENPTATGAALYWEPSAGQGMPGMLAQEDPSLCRRAEAPTAASVSRMDHATAAPVDDSAPGYGGPGPRAWPTWAFLLLLLACWLPYLIAAWPGTVSNDSITQLAEIFGRKALSNGNPVFQTGLIWLAVAVGQRLFGSADAAIALYACVQGVLMAWLLGHSLRRMEEVRAPGWLIGLATAFYALCPIFPVFAFCMGKDTAFAMAVLWLTLMVWRVLSSKWPPMRTTIGLCLSAVLCALLRNAGLALAAVTLASLLIWAFTAHTRQWRAPLAALVCVGIAVGLLNAVVLPKLAAEPMPETENWSVPLQQVARVVAGEALTEEEYDTVNAVLPVGEIKLAYDGELSDSVKALWRTDATAEQKAAFFAVWVRLGLKYPATYLSATFHNGYGYLLPGYVSTIKPTFLLGMEGHTTLIDGMFDFTVNPNANTLKAALQSLFQYTPFRLLTAPGAYGWITLFALAAILGRRQKRNALCMLPALLTLLGCLFSAVNGYFRYAMPLYFVAPVLLAALSQASFYSTRIRRRE